MFQRKIYDKLLSWKREAAGEKALLIEGARRIGKSTIVEEFAKKEYKSYILIDFSEASKVVTDAFDNYLSDLDTFFMLLQTEYGKTLYPGESVIIFDEVQKFPKARESVKRLVKDGRYHYIETGSLISIKENVEDIIIPSEERPIKMYPMDFEEFCISLGEEKMIEYITECFVKKTPLEQHLHHKAMLLLRQYILIGGMPKSVDAFISNGRTFSKSDEEKRDILNLYREDIRKIDKKYQAKVSSIFDQIPGFLSKHEKRVMLRSIEAGSTFDKYENTFFWLSDSMICNECFNCNDPNVGLSINEDRTYIKCYMGDTGLLISHTFDEREIVEEDLYRSIILGKLSINEGMFFENVVCQMLVASGYKPYFYTHYDEVSHHNDIEIDFLISNGSKTKYKVFPIEVKSTPRYSTSSIDKFSAKFKERIGCGYIIHTKNLKVEDGKIFIPAYMTFCL